MLYTRRLYRRIVREPAPLTSTNARHDSEHGPVALVPDSAPATVDSLTVWSQPYQQLAVAGVRSEEVAKKIALQLGRFLAFYHDRVSSCLKRDVVAWLTLPR